MRRNRVLVIILSFMILIGLRINIYAGGGSSLVVECPLSGMEVYIYRVADDNGLVSPFDNYPVDLNGDRQLCANALINYIKVDNISADEYVVSGVDNKAYFNGLEKGLYLISVKSVDDGTYIYTPQVSLVNLDGLLELELKYDKSEKTKVNLHVLKVWENDNVDKRPSSIEVSLLRDGSVFDKQELNKLNHWSFTWNDLDSFYSWDVIEDNVPSGYTVGISKSGNTVMITNTGVGGAVVKEPDRITETGQLRWPVPLLVIVGVVCLIIGRKDEK